MVYITEDMVRRRAEHNECEIFSLEEVSLHQQNIERIEHIERWCRDLKILYLQNNLIPRIENVGRLKKLEYLNLALNNIEVIENLQGCESLQKLDLTVNFVGQLSSVTSLKHNIHLRLLFLVGNPCTEFQGYRQYVVAALPQLQWLDGQEISRSERIEAGQGLGEVKRRVQKQEQEYMRRRAKEREEAKRKGAEGGETEKDTGLDLRQDTDSKTIIPGREEHLDSVGEREDEAQLEREFWDTPCAYTPESRLEAHRHLEEKNRSTTTEREKPQKAPRTLITAEGRVLNINEPKLDFSLTEDEESGTIVLDLAVYRHMDTSLMDVDIQPTSVRVVIKGKIFQLALPSEVRPDSSRAERSQTTGHLLLSMPRAEGEIKVKKTIRRPAKMQPSSKKSEGTQREKVGREWLEADPGIQKVVDLANIVPRGDIVGEGPLEVRRTERKSSMEMDSFSEGFQDNPEVPALI